MNVSLLGRTVWRAKLNPSDSFPWVAVRRAKLNPAAAGPGFRGWESSSFYGLKHWKSLTTESILQNMCAYVKFFTGLSGPGVHLGSMKLRQKPTRRQFFGTSTATAGLADHLLLAKPSDESCADRLVHARCPGGGL